MKSIPWSLAACTLLVLFIVSEPWSASHAGLLTDAPGTALSKDSGNESDPSLFSIQHLTDRPSQEKFVDLDSDPETTERNREAMAQALMSNDLEMLSSIVGEHGQMQGFSANMGLDGARPLMLVQSGGAAQILLDHGADPNLADENGFTPLHFAVTHERGEEIVPVLLKAGADVHARDSEQMTPLMLLKFVFTELKEYGRGQRLLEMLARAGADINAQDSQGYSLLHDAASNDNVPLARALLSLGALKDMRNAQSQTPLDIAITLNSKNIVPLLQ